jgi:hypothetical protein
MAPSPPAITDGSKTWTPDSLFSGETSWDKIYEHLQRNEFRAAITTAFQLPLGDTFTYHATASVNLPQAEAAAHAGRKNGLHAWYIAPVTDGETVNEEYSIPGQPSLRIVGYPPLSDVEAYISLFDATKSPANILKSLVANAKKDSLRAEVAKYLTLKRYLDPVITIPKAKAPHQNPAFDFWKYACQQLEFAGPNTNTALCNTSHHILPIYMHHFSCVVPSYESVSIISKLALTTSGKAVLDMGSGNGYWTFMLRRLNPALTVTAVDNAQSKWRTTWIDDTLITDGITYLRKRSGCPDSLLLLVYPIVSGEFTRKVVDAYEGDVLVVVGTQNGNGYTGFKDMMVDEYMEGRGGWEMVARVPLPSFPGKDDALFAFRRKRRDEGGGE